MKYPIFIEKDEDSDFGVTVPDLPGCFSAGTSYEEALENAEEAILTHIEGLLADDDPIPKPTSIAGLRKHYDSNSCIWALLNVDLGKLSKDVKRVNISMPENILSKIDTYAEKEGKSRSGLLATAAIEYIAQHGA